MEKIQTTGGIPIRTGYNIKIYRCLALLLTVVFLAGLSGAANAQEVPWGQPLRWEEIDKPGLNGEIILAPSEVNRIAASHDVVYALDDNTTQSHLHRSDNGGLTFTDITGPLERMGGVASPGDEIAVAPGLPQYVALVTDNRTQVYISDDSGATWQPTSLTLPGAEKIQCIAISNGYTSGSNTVLHDVAIGTAQWGSANGHIWTFQMGGSFSTWTNNNIDLPIADISAVAFSPRYKDDFTVLAMASNSDTENATYLCIGKRDPPSQTTTWDSTSDYPGYPVTIISSDNITTPGIQSNIALPSDYGGANPATRLAFLSYRNVNPINSGSNDIYKIDDDASQRVQRLNVNGGAPVNISSIAYFGTQKSGKLLAGLTDPSGPNVAQVKWTVNPLGTPLGPPAQPSGTTPTSLPRGRAMRR